MYSSFFQVLISLDQSLFLAINKSGHVSWLDGFFLLLRHQNTWIPLYLFVLYKVYKARPDMLFKFIIASFITFAITDYTIASIIKPWVARLRPCYDEVISNQMNQLLDCGGKYSFPSSHAANHFGLASVWFNIIYFLKKHKWYWVWPWAASICYAQIYVGKHFPLDIAAGALLGILTGLLVSKIFIVTYQNFKGKFNSFAIQRKRFQTDELKAAK